MKTVKGTALACTCFNYYWLTIAVAVHMKINVAKYMYSLLLADPSMGGTGNRPLTTMIGSYCSNLYLLAPLMYESGQKAPSFRGSPPTSHRALSLNHVLIPDPIIGSRLI